MKASDATDIFFGAIGLLSGFLWLSRYNARLRLDARYQPVILRNSDDDALSMDECCGK
jgi:positive regulator of sigma E activity